MCYNKEDDDEAFATILIVVAVGMITLLALTLAAEWLKGWFVA